MKIDKQIRELPWPDAFDGMKNQHFRMKVSQPVMNHERLLVVTFSWNQKNKEAHGQDFRVVCSKKLPGAAVLFKGDNRTRRKRLHEVLGNYVSYGYPEISEQEEKTLAKWLGKKTKESRNHFLPELADWVNMAIQTEIQRERDARGELRDEDVFLCQEELPEGLETYIRRVVLPNDRTLIYKKGNVRGL